MDIAAQNIPSTGEAYFEFLFTVAFYHVANKDFQSAKLAWENLILSEDLITPFYTLGNHYLAQCLYRSDDIEGAKEHFQVALQDSIEIGHQRHATFANIGLAMIDLKQGQLETAATRLAESTDQAHKYQDRELTARCQNLYAHLHILRGDIPAARAALTEAIDLFERMGMRRELAEAREELARLAEGEAAIHE